MVQIIIVKTIWSIQKNHLVLHLVLNIRLIKESNGKLCSFEKILQNNSQLVLLTRKTNSHGKRLSQDQTTPHTLEEYSSSIFFYQPTIHSGLPSARSRLGSIIATSMGSVVSLQIFSRINGVLLLQSQRLCSLSITSFTMPTQITHSFLRSPISIRMIGPSMMPSLECGLANMQCNLISKLSRKIRIVKENLNSRLSKKRNNADNK